MIRLLIVFAVLGLLPRCGGIRLQTSRLKESHDDDLEQMYDVEEWHRLIADSAMKRSSVGGDQDAAREICINGTSMPRLFMLGAGKSATTSLAAHLMSSGMVKEQEKEKYCFQELLPKGAPLEQRVNLAKTCYEKTCYGQICYDPNTCTKSGVGDVVSDLTPWYLDRAARIPQEMQTFYGQNSDKLVFSLILREPLRRMHSEYWYFRGKLRFVRRSKRDFLNMMGDFDDDSFNDVKDPSPAVFMHQQLKRYSEGVTSHWMQCSLYGSSLKTWLSAFPHAQFVVIPMKAYAARPGEVLHAIAAKLDTRKASSYNRSETEALRANVHHLRKHSLEKDLAKASNGTTLKEGLDAIFDKDIDLLSSLLADGITKGMSLPTYTGDNSAHSIREWLEANW